MAGGRYSSPTLERIGRLVELMADPHRQYPVVHLTGTNGKTSTAGLVTSLLVARGMSVGSYTSPHLERINERLAWNGEPISDGALVELLSVVADVADLLEEPPSWFEIMTAAAFRWFADVAVDVAVLEVGLGGRWDATNVADGAVAVVTNIGLDHIAFLGPTRADVAREKSGIVKPGSHLVLGERDLELAEVVRSAGPAAHWQIDRDFGCTTNHMAHGGRLLDIRTPGAAYEGVYLPLHGAHQGDNAACAVAAAEAFFGAPLGDDVVTEGLGAARAPGRVEVVQRRPLVVLDGIKNPEGAHASTAALTEEFANVASRIVVVGLLAGRDPAEVLEPLALESARLVIGCQPDTPRAVPATEVAAAATKLGARAEAAGSVGQAVERALALAERDDLVLVTGSLYVVGEARTLLLSR